VGAHWNADGHDYEPAVRQMLAELEESISPDRPLICTRPWCRARYTRNHNRCDACLYHPGEIKIEMRPPGKEDDIIELLGEQRLVPRDSGRRMDDLRRNKLLQEVDGVKGPAVEHHVPLELVPVKIWSCCGALYVDLHSLDPTNPKGKELKVGKHGQHRGATTNGFKFRENLPCTRCPHF
jgi:hypothetical protein